MDRSDSGKGYNGEVAGEVKMVSWEPGMKKGKLPDIQKAMKNACILADKTPLINKERVSVIPKKLNEKKVTKVLPKKGARIIPKKILKDPVFSKKKLQDQTLKKKVQVKSVVKPVVKPVVRSVIKPVVKPVIKPIKPPTMDEIIEDLSFIKEIKEGEKQMEPVKNSIKPKFEIWTPEEDVKSEGISEKVNLMPFPRKEIILFESISDPKELDHVCELGSRMLIVERDHPIYFRVLNALGAHFREKDLRLQRVKKGTLYELIFGEAIQKITEALRGRVHKIPSYGYIKDTKRHNFLIADLMYTRTNTAYYILMDLLEESNIMQRFILVNTDIIFSK